MLVHEKRHKSNKTIEINAKKVDKNSKGNLFFYKLNRKSSLFLSFNLSISIFVKTISRVNCSMY